MMRELLRKERLNRNLTQEDIANKVGINRATYTNIELGNKNPSLEVALKIKEVLKHEKDDIFLNQ